MMGFEAGWGSVTGPPGRGKLLIPLVCPQVKCWEPARPPNCFSIRATWSIPLPALPRAEQLVALGEGAFSPTGQPYPATRSPVYK